MIRVLRVTLAIVSPCQGYQNHRFHRLKALQQHRSEDFREEMMIMMIHVIIKIKQSLNKNNTRITKIMMSVVIMNC